MGLVSIVRASWNTALIDELRAFPGRHDDQIDALSRAFNFLTPGTDDTAVYVQIAKRAQEAGTTGLLILHPPRAKQAAGGRPDEMIELWPRLLHLRSH